jgi:acyl carrier protein
MQDLTPRIIAILPKYMRDPSACVERTTALSDLEIDELDLPMLVLDIEDVFNVEIQCDDEIEGITTVQSLADFVSAKVVPARTRSSVPRSTRGWLSTGAEQRR